LCIQVYSISSVIKCIKNVRHCSSVIPSRSMLTEFLTLGNNKKAGKARLCLSQYEHTYSYEGKTHGARIRDKPEGVDSLVLATTGGHRMKGCQERKGMSKDEKASKSKVSRRSLTCGRCNICPAPVYPNPYSPRWVGGTTSSKYVLYSRLEHYCCLSYAAPCLSYIAP
jgi:hypothetical protein